MAESKIKDENYYQISGWMLNRLKLKGIALEVFAIIYGFSQDGESEFKGSISYLCDFTGASKPTIIKALKELVENNYIKKIEIEINGVKFNKYKANLQVVKNFNRGGKEILLGGSKETLPNNNINNNKINNIDNIICFLNEKTGKHYKSSIKKTQSLIIARVEEGFTEDDFKKVIEIKCKEWKGTEWEKYLRPETLFGTKFESYLNSKTTKNQVFETSSFDLGKAKNKINNFD